MAKTINEFRLKLLSKIRQAETAQLISRYIDTAIRTLVRKKVNGHLILRFLDRSVADLQGDGAECTQLPVEEKTQACIDLLNAAKSQITKMTGTTNTPA